MTLPVDIAEHYAARKPFAIYRFPGEDTVYVAGEHGDFYINTWNSASKDNILIEDASGIPGLFSQPWTVSTNRDAYMASTNRLIAAVARRGGKCVRSRVIAAHGVRIDLNGVVSELFRCFPTAFCHCYYTPATGLWAGATPELLADVHDGCVTTMALAGTRHSGTDEPWDSKNVEEQELVTRFICDCMLRSGLEPRTGITRTLRYGTIEHICTDIKADGCGDNVMPLLDLLSPTPAIAGYPRAMALAEIEEYEDTPRRCYGGYVMVREGNSRLRAYVNLRCAQLAPDAWCVYAGGGITPQSHAHDEWHETEAKSAAWLDILSHNTLSL